MESYIVRIYRRDASEPGRMDGVVEGVPAGEQTAFHDMAALWQILAASPRQRARARKKAAKNVGTRASDNDGKGG